MVFQADAVMTFSLADDRNVVYSLGPVKGLMYINPFEFLGRPQMPVVRADQLVAAQ